MTDSKQNKPRCIYCKGTGKYKKPLNQEKFEMIIDQEMDKSYFVNYAMAEEKAYKIIGFTLIECPFCGSDSHQ